MASDEFNQPIHQALSGYALLEVAKCEDVHFSLDQPLSWRMNLCAISQLYPTKYFIAVNNKVCVYGLTGSLVFTQQPIMVLKPSIDPEFMINAIKLGAMKLSPDGPTAEILTAVGDNGEIFAWNTHDLFSSSSTTTTDKPFLHRHNVGLPPAAADNNEDEENSDDTSTWGIAIHVDGLIAVSANNHRITIYNLWAPPLAQHSGNNRIQQQQQQQQPYPQNRLGERTQVELAGHVHNIPCIDFDSSGRFLASGSVDMTCRLWDLATLQQVGKRFMTRNMDSDAWLWGVKFIPTGHFKSATCDASSALAKTLRRYRQQGRAAGTTDLHMAHSATYPIYQLDMQQMFHRLNTSDLTDEDEREEDDIDPATSNLIRLSTLLSRHLERAPSNDDDDDDNDGLAVDDDEQFLYPPDEENNGDDEQATEIAAARHPHPLQRQIDDDAADADLLDWEDAYEHGGDIDSLEDQWYPNDDDDDDDGDGDVEDGGPVDAVWRNWADHDDDDGDGDDDGDVDSQLDDRLDHLLAWNTNHWDSDENQDDVDDDDDDGEGDVDSHLDNYIDHLMDWNTNGNQHVADDDDESPSPIEDNDNDFFDGNDDDDDDHLSGWNNQHMNYTDDLSQLNNNANVLPGGWDGNQREDYDDLLAEEEGWMQDRTQFPWHWLGVRGGPNDQDQDVSSWLQDGTTEQDDVARQSTTTEPINRASQATASSPQPKVLFPTTTTTTTIHSSIPYVFEPTGTIAPQAPNDTLTDYLMITSKRDAYLLHSTISQQGQQWTMATVQRERRVVSRADARTAFVLDMMERLSFVEWIPDLELCVVASQKGCVSLMRVLQVQIYDHQHHHHKQQTCLFNHEKYLPLYGLQNSVLYGMTVHRLPSEQQYHLDRPVYQLSLLYLDGTMRSYRLSKPTNSSLLDLASVL